MKHFNRKASIDAPYYPSSLGFSSIPKYIFTLFPKFIYWLRLSPFSDSPDVSTTAAAVGKLYTFNEIYSIFQVLQIFNISQLSEYASQRGWDNTTKPSSHQTIQPPNNPTTQRTTTVVAEWFSRKKVQGEKKWNILNVN